MASPVTRHFDQLSGRYGSNFANAKCGKNFAFRKRVELVSSLVAHSSGVLLDCACGTGEVSASALSSGSFSRAVLVDASAAMLDHVRTREDLASTDIELLHSDVFEFQTRPGEEFDVILCVGLIAHTGELPRLLVHLRPMLKRDGQILLQTSLTDHLGVRIVRRVTANRHGNRLGYRLSYFSLADIAAASRRSGFDVKQVHRYCFGLPFGDNLCPIANYWLERIMTPLSATIGAEALCVLTPS